MVRAIIFDCFGVIRQNSNTQAYIALGGDPIKDRQIITNAVKDSNLGIIPSSTIILAKRLGVSLQTFRQKSKEISELNTELLDYILELRTHYKIGLLTNLSRGGILRWFEPGELETYFDATVASGDVGHAKPQPKIYHLIAERLGVEPSECIMIDDIPSYCEGARAVGMQAICYKSLAQLQAELQALLADAED